MKYTWETYKDAELWFNDKFDTIEDCVKNAKENGIESGKIIYVGEIVPWEPYVNAISILKDLEREADMECGEVADSWVTFDWKKDIKKVEELSDKLTEIVKQWLKDNGRYPDFYEIENVIEVEVE